MLFLMYTSLSFLCHAEYVSYTFTYSLVSEASQFFSINYAICGDHSTR